ncbi:MAG: hypothetical protein KKA60_16405 [Proteobacteria bacterium]|nr:hypothetical protein [Pseudomonadota bacterium]
MGDATKSGAYYPLNAYSVFDELGFSGNMPPNIRQIMFELAEIRNIIVHKAGRADKRFLEKCPWIKCKLYEPIIVIQKDMNRYISAAFWYLIELDQRWQEKFDKKQGSPSARKLQEEINASLSSTPPDEADSPTVATDSSGG